MREVLGVREFGEVGSLISSCSAFRSLTEVDSAGLI